MGTIINLIIKYINFIWNFLSSLYDFRKIYKYTGVFFTRKFKKAKKNHKYAILVAARNEAAVIGNMIDSVKKNDYPQELVEVFVVADNCTDNTAQVAREHGAICYERFDNLRRTKGFALQYMVELIRRDYGIETFDGYFIFDADNLLKRDYLARMNESFDAGEKIVTSYRNTKNFDDNWISASYGIHWLRTARTESRARSIFRLATRIQGTGILFASEILRDGWKYTGLTEDRAFCADAVANGYKISFNNDAQFYDEQPVDIKMAMRQRLRWSKGHLQALVETGPKLLSHIFITKGLANKDIDGNPIPNPLWKRIFYNLRLRFMSFDMLTVVFPLSLVSSFRKITVYFLRVALILGTGKVIGMSYAPGVISNTFKFLHLDPSFSTPMQNIFWLAFFTFGWTISTYLSGIFTAAYVYLFEHKRIKKIAWYKKIWFCMTFPIFDLIGKLTLIIALFKRIEWDPIAHIAVKSIDELQIELGDTYEESENSSEEETEEKVEINL
ncbi:MAG: glycosyltransferase [Ruminococcaceae bacterium]|nr:glycosyltransferase [Oscillospiraceae bacterium]